MEAATDGQDLVMDGGVGRVRFSSNRRRPHFLVLKLANCDQDADALCFLFFGVIAFFLWGPGEKGKGEVESAVLGLDWCTF